MLSSGREDRFGNHLHSWPKIVVAIVAGWLTLTISLHVILSSLGNHHDHHLDNPKEWAARVAPSAAKPEATLRKNYHNHHHPAKPNPKNLLSAHEKVAPSLTAKEKLELYAAKKRAAPSLTATTKEKLTAKEKLERYAAKKQQDHQQDVKPKLRNKKPSSAQEMTPRQVFEEQYPPSNKDRIRSFVDSLRRTDLEQGMRQTSAKHFSFDLFDCPETPPPNYPLHYSLVEMLEEWPADQLQWPTVDATTSDHPYLYQSLCIFDWNRPEHRERARRYQVDFDVPFIVQNHPEIMQTTERWMRNDPNYLQELIGDEPQRNEHSFHSNHLPFWRILKGSKPPAGWKAPTENVQQSFAQWSARSDILDQAIAEGQNHTTLDRYYFRLNVDFNRNEYMYNELPLFDPRRFKTGENIFMLYPEEGRGINCRLGMSGNIAELHYDYSSNWIFLLGGNRRYILAHPKECSDLSLHPEGHPSGRHSSVNWSEIQGAQAQTTQAAQGLKSAMAHQVVLQASDALFLPTSWFHFIVSLSRNYQCNARSGIVHGNDPHIKQCGFTVHG